MEGSIESFSKEFAFLTFRSNSIVTPTKNVMMTMQHVLFPFRMATFELYSIALCLKVYIRF